MPSGFAEDLSEVYPRYTLNDSGMVTTGSTSLPSWEYMAMDEAAGSGWLDIKAPNLWKGKDVPERHLD